MSQIIPPGPEDVPTLGYIKSFKMIVTIYDKKRIVIKTQLIDYGNQEHRKWIGRVTYWACSNGMTVETSAA